MWQSFTAIGWGTAEGSWRKKKKKKTSRAFYKSSRTTVTGGLKTSVTITSPTYNPKNHTEIRKGSPRPSCRGLTTKLGFDFWRGLDYIFWPIANRVTSSVTYTVCGNKKDLIKDPIKQILLFLVCFNILLRNFQRLFWTQFAITVANFIISTLVVPK